VEGGVDVTLTCATAIGATAIGSPTEGALAADGVVGVVDPVGPVEAVWATAAAAEVQIVKAAAARLRVRMTANRIVKVSGRAECRARLSRSYDTRQRTSGT
jgi:hypothetical protein